MRVRGVYLLSLASCVGLIAAACGGSSLTPVEGGDGGASTQADAGHATTPDATATPACIPGQSVACVGPGGCSTNQVCNSDGSGFGPCDCAPALPDSGTPGSGDAGSLSSSDAGALACIPGQSVACAGPGGCSTNQVCNSDGSGFGPCDCAPLTDASTLLCVPGQSIACSGAGGCISSQACNDAGTGYGACVCARDGGTTFLCVPGQSIACGGPYGCASFQACDEAGTGYGPCDCPEGGTSSYYYDDGGLPDGYAPLPPPVGDQGYNAIWAPGVEGASLFLPLYSAPDCSVVPPYGESYVIQFFPTDTGSGPSGTLSACPALPSGSATCYLPGISVGTGFSEEVVPGGVYTLSAFNADGIATGQMNTTEGIVPLVVKNCQ